MPDYPVLIPTLNGPMGGIVTEPEGERRGALILVAGFGGQRFGANRIWTSMAWDLADRGYVVLRMDYPGGKGDSIMAKKDRGPIPITEVAGWFRRQTSDLGLVLLGSCYGARMALAIGSESEDLIGLGFLSPVFMQSKRLTEEHEGAEPLSSKVRRGVMRKIAPAVPVRIDPHLARNLARAINRTSVWIMMGERDLRSRAEVVKLRSMLNGQAENGFAVEEVPGLLLHGQPSLEAQRITRERVVSWASGLLDNEEAH